MSTFALIHGGGGTSWDWHLVSSELREHGHDPVAVDLPSEDGSAGLEYADTLGRGRRSQRPRRLGHSLGGFTAPLVCARMPAQLLVLVAAMVPSPGELFADWWTNAGYEKSGYEDVFYHDVPPALAAEAKRRERGEDSKALQEPWPLQAWPDMPTRYLLCRDDRMFPRRLGAPPRPRAAQPRGRRDRRRPLHHAQPPARAGRAARNIRRDHSINRCGKARGGQRSGVHLIEGMTLGRWRSRIVREWGSYGFGEQEFEQVRRAREELRLSWRQPRTCRRPRLELPARSLPLLDPRWRYRLGLLGWALCRSGCGGPALVSGSRDAGGLPDGELA